MKNKKLIIGIAGGLIAVLIVGGVILFNHSKGASSKGNITHTNLCCDTFNYVIQG